jgi:monoamine oxidase
VWTTYGTALTEPIGRIHWAGTEMAEAWPGFFEGAIRTAEKAVEAIKRSL